MPAAKPPFSVMELKDPLKIKLNQPTEGLKSVVLPGETCLERAILWKHTEEAVSS